VYKGLRLALLGLAMSGLPACDGGDEPVTGQSASLPPGTSRESDPGTPGASGAGAGVSCEGATCDAPGGASAGSSGLGASPVPGAAPGDNAPASSTPAGADPSSTPDSGPSPAPAGPLPDLVLDAAYLLDTTLEDTVQTDDVCLLNEGCVTGLGERRVVRFGSRTGNLGTAPLELGNPADSPYWTLDSCHETYDLLGFARYELLAAATGEVVLSGTKNNFCLRDSEPWAQDEGASCNAYTYDCTSQGITQGCADNYGSELECQWVDITDVPAGAYTLRVTINASRAIPELDYTNNVVEVSLEIADDAVRVER
jgi:hypothetical protein